MTKKLKNENTNKIIYYYQTFVGLDDLFSKKNIPVTHIHLSSIHFGVDLSNNPYIHLNDDSPDYYDFESVWKDMKKASDLGIKIVLMIGGAGGGYASFFSNYDTYLQLLFDTIQKYDMISGVDLDIEEPVDINNVKKLIIDLKVKFGENFSISIAPIQSSLQEDEPGMGGFCYKDLYNSEVGKYIDYFNVQFYSNFSEISYDDCVNNGYPPEKLVMGMISGMNYDNILSEIYTISHKYKDKFGGVFNWEYFNSPPYGNKDPARWSIEVFNEINKIKKSNFSFANKIQYMLDYFAD